MVFPVFPNHMTTAMTSLQLASFWILPQVNSVAASRINFILDHPQWVVGLLNNGNNTTIPNVGNSQAYVY